MQAEIATSKAPAARASLFHLPDFRLFWAGHTLVLFAVQFYVVGLTWLLVQLTDSGLALGTVLMVNAIPRAVFMLVGGALSDRVAPRRILFFTVAVNALVLAAVGLLLRLDAMSIALLYVVAAVVGLMDAFFYPAALSILPRLVEREQLASANAITQGAESITNILEPAVSGVAISALGLPAAFGINTLLFASGALLLRGIRIEHDPLDRHQSMGSAIREGLRFAWDDPAIRLCLFLIAALNFAFIGPILVGGAGLAETRFGGEASAFGGLLSASGVGALVGIVISGVIKPPARPVLLLGGLGGGLGIGLIALGMAETLAIASLIMALMGIGAGYISVAAVTWLQGRTPPQMQGRMMSLLVFASVALDPFSQAFSGMLLDVSVGTLFTVAGALMLLTGAVTFASPASREAD